MRYLRKKVLISFPLELLEQLDKTVTDDWNTRSHYVCEAVELKLKVDKYVATTVSDKTNTYNYIKHLNTLRMIKTDIRRNPPTEIH